MTCYPICVIMIKKEMMYLVKDIYVDRLKSIFKGMKDRCYSPNRENYAIYGGRGIEICDRWKDSFETFYHNVPEYTRLYRRVVNGTPS